MAKLTKPQQRVMDCLYAGGFIQYVDGVLRLSTGARVDERTYRALLDLELLRHKPPVSMTGTWHAR